MSQISGIDAILNSSGDPLVTGGGSGGGGGSGSANVQVMHVQDQKATTVEGGSSVSGTQTRTLNTVVSNTIEGAIRLTKVKKFSFDWYSTFCERSPFKFKKGSNKFSSILSKLFILYILYTILYRLTSIN